MSSIGLTKRLIPRLFLLRCHRILHLNMPDPFATLPAPLPLIIMEAIEDLPTVHNLLLASPAASYYFEQYYVEVTEAILSNYEPELQELFRTMIWFRSNAECRRHELASPKDLTNFLMSYFLRRSTRITSLSKATISTQAIRSSITSAGVIHLASDFFFATKGQRPVPELPKPSWIEEQ